MTRPPESATECPLQPHTSLRGALGHELELSEESSQTHLSAVMKAAKRDIEYSQFAFHSSRAGLKDSVRAQLQCRSSSSLRQPNLALDSIGLLSAADANSNH